MADTDQVLMLAAIIRMVDGNHSKGAAALAESILDHPSFYKCCNVPAPPADGEVAELLEWLRQEFVRNQRIGKRNGAGRSADLRHAAEQARSTLEGWANYGYWVWPESALEQAKRNTIEALAALNAALADEPAVPAPPADGEVADRAAELLQRQVQVPMSVDERLPGLED